MKGSANAAWITWGKAPRSDERSTVTGPEIAAVERREARVPVTRHAGAFVRCPVDLRRSGAPLPHGRGRRNEGAGPAPMTKGADGARLLATDCLRSEDVSV